MLYGPSHDKYNQRTMMENIKDLSYLSIETSFQDIQMLNFTKNQIQKFKSVFGILTIGGYETQYIKTI